MLTKQIGSINELECIAAFAKLGFTILLPYGDFCKYDFVVEKNQKFYRIQCKTAKILNNTIKINCRTSNKKDGHSIHYQYSKDEIDFFATSYMGKCYIIPISECNTLKTLRFEKSKNNQIQNISYANEYLIENIFSKL